MCKVLVVSTSGYYAWLEREPSTGAQQDQILVEKARQIHKASSRRYGSPRVYRQMKAEGIEVGRNRVARLMRETVYVFVRSAGFVARLIRITTIRSRITS